MSTEKSKEILPFVGTTKQVIYDAYLKAEKQLEALQSQQLNPQAIAAGKEKEAVLTSAQAVVGTSVQTVVETLRSTLDSAITGVVTEFETKTAEFTNLDKAITLKKDELEEIYGIEAKAGSLAALVNAHEVTKATQEAELKEAKAIKDAELAAVQQQIKDANKLHTDTLAEQKAIREEAQKRAQEEWDYTFGRQKKAQEDALADEKAAKEKEFADRTAQLDAREAAIAAREANVNELETKVAEIPTLVEKATAAGKAQGKAAAEKEAKYEKEALEANKDAEIRILTNKGELLQSQLDAANTTNKELSSQLTDAYARLESVAKASVDGSKAEELASKVVAMVNEKSSK